MSPRGPRGGAGNTATEEKPQKHAHSIRHGVSRVAARKHCAGCGIPLDARAPHYLLCPKCFAYSALYAAIRDFRGVTV
jgi:hypothetical protein